MFDWVLAHDHASDATFLAALGRGPDERRARRSAGALLDARRAELAAFGPQVPEPGPHRQGQAPAVRGHFDRAGYEAAVRECQVHIERGDAYENCLTHRLEAPFAGDPWLLYRELRAVSPSPFACYLGLPDAAIVSLVAGAVPAARPARRRRGRSRSRAPARAARPRREDAALRADLASSPKDRAENLMIVDLVRNDLGRVCEIGRSRRRRCSPSSLRDRHQLVSTVRGGCGRRRDDLDVCAALSRPAR